MEKPTFSVTCVATDRTRSLATSEVTAPECDLRFDFGEPEVIFRDALTDHRFEICELSMSSHMVTTARGDSAYVGVPVFL